MNSRREAACGSVVSYHEGKAWIEVARPFFYAFLEEKKEYLETTDIGLFGLWLRMMVENDNYCIV
jgi:hypothetical protein